MFTRPLDSIGKSRREIGERVEADLAAYLVIILDTNVVSEPMKPDGDRGVQAWLDEQIAETLYITSISISDLLLGVELLPDGKRKEGLAGWPLPNGNRSVSKTSTALRRQQC